MVPLTSALFDSFVHGRLPYENLKPDPVLRHLLQSLPIRKVVSCSNFTSEIIESSLGRGAEVFSCPETDIYQWR